MAFASSVPLALPNTYNSLNRSATRRPAPSISTWNMSVLTTPVFKQALLDRVKPLNFGRAVTDQKFETDEIEELIKQVEATNKSASPGTDPNLSGTWDMIYTTSSSILGTGKPSFLQASRIVQEINAADLTAQNAETFKFGPIQLVNAVDAKLKPVSDSRFDVNFIKFNIFGLFTIDVEKNDRFTGWLDVTYLDEDMRISRGNKGNVFLLIKK